ncbi:MAG: calcium/sodium antiporter [Spirochaetales bacterium]|nr:calcium/sodium antiporter [Spirochaetales bacterium]
MEIFLNFLILAAGLILVIKGADFLVDGASSLAVKMGVPQLVIGLTIVAFGTSMPELIVNLSASFEGKNQIVLGNILGSCIYNILLILGIGAIITPLSIKSSTKWKEIPMAFGSILLIFILANTGFTKELGFTKDLYITRLESILLLLSFAAFMWYTIHIALSDNASSEEEPKYNSSLHTMLLIIAGFASLLLGGKFTVEGAVHIATVLNVSEKLIALTIVSIGTSLPELATSAVAAYKKQADIAVGNVIGSNIFNILLILGLSSVVTPIAYPAELNIDILVLGIATVFLFLVTFIKDKNVVGRPTGIIFVASAVIYTIYLIFRG